MTLPTVITEIGFTAGPTTGIYLHLDDESRGLLDTNTLAPDDILTDVSADVRSVTTRRGCTRVEGPVLRYEAGTSTTVLKDKNRDYDPDNLAGPYVAGGVTQVEPMRVIRHRATWNGVTYNLWRGFVDEWLHADDDPSNQYSEATVPATDGFITLADNDRPAVTPVGAGEDTGARVGRILDSAGWETADRVIAAGDTTVQATTLNGPALAELFLVVDTEVGEGYIDAGGRFVFRNRHAALTDPRSNTSQATFGDGGGSELPYARAVRAYDRVTMANDVRIAREGGAQQAVEDGNSQARYRIKTHNRTDLLMETDALALDYANFVLHLAKDPEKRIAQLVVNPHRDEANLFPQVLGREIGDRITVKRRPPGGGAVITQDYFIRGIEHRYTPEAWSTTWTLQLADAWSFLVLDHATLGQLDENALAY